MMTLAWFVFVSAVLLVFGVAPPAHAQKEMDHLICYAAKDSDDTTVREDVTVEHFGTQSSTGVPGPRNCIVKGKAKVHCVRTVKNGGDDPRGADPGTDYACFTLVCEKDLTNYTVSTDTQLGPHSFVTAGNRARGKLLCAPTGNNLDPVP